MWGSLYLAWTYIELGEVEKAIDLIDKPHKFALEVKNNSLLAYADASRAMLLRAQKKWQESIAEFEKSLQEYEALGARRWNVYVFARIVLYEYARVYLERDLEGDREKAHTLLNQALEIFEKMGAKNDAEKTMKLIEVLQPAKVQASEKTVRQASCVCDDVRSNIIASPRELKIGESLELEIEVTNTSKEGTVLLTRIIEVIPEGFAVTKKPELYRIEGDCLIIREKRLGPSITDVVKLVLTPKIQGKFLMRPKIVYLDQNGKEKTCEPEPISVTVKELGIKGWLKGEG
jgi:tetratricopeptide (TPR) repeat protein